MILLHLSDLHFGWDAGDAKAQAERTLALDALLELLPALETKHGFKIASA